MKKKYQPDNRKKKSKLGNKHWFCRENIQDLVANINASATTKTLKRNICFGASRLNFGYNWGKI